MNPSEYDYTNAGFDGFLSRSIDDLSQVNLDSPGPTSTAIRYDSSQLSGVLGDSYRMKNILFDGKKGRTSYYNNQDLFMLEGELQDRARGIRFQNPGGMGLAQFGVFKDNKLALKIAKDGFDAATASDDQLIFDSSRNVFKIVKIIPLTVSVAYVANATPNGNQYNISSKAHGLGFIPSYTSNIIMDSSAAAQNGTSPTVRYANLAQLLGFVGAHVTSYCTVWVTIDETNVYLEAIMDTQAFTNGTYTYTATVYLLQEAFTVPG